MKKIDSETERAARAFLGRLVGEYAPLEALLYGSRARGDHTPESDADIAVVLRGAPGNRYKAAVDMSDIAYDVMLETGIYISPLPLWESEMIRPERFSNPALIACIKREGVPL